MSELRKGDSDSELSSNSSWTLVNEETNSDNETSNKACNHKEVSLNEKQYESECSSDNKDFSDSLEEIKVNDKLIDLSSNKVANHSWPTEEIHEDDVVSLATNSNPSLHCLNESVSKEDIAEHGCLTLKEFLQERELEHDYEYDEKANRWQQYWHRNQKGKKRKYKRCKANNLDTLKIIGAVLSIAGISFICMLAPNFGKHDLNKEIQKNFTKVDSELAYENNCQIYLDKSNSALKLVDPGNTLEACILENCVCDRNTNNHIHQCHKECNPSTFEKDGEGHKHPKSEPKPREEFLEGNLKKAANKTQNKYSKKVKVDAKTENCDKKEEKQVTQDVSNADKKPMEISSKKTTKKEQLAKDKNKIKKTKHTTEIVDANTHEKEPELISSVNSDPIDERKDKLIKQRAKTLGVISRNTERKNRKLTKRRASLLREGPAEKSDPALNLENISFKPGDQIKKFDPELKLKNLSFNIVNQTEKLPKNDKEPTKKLDSTPKLNDFKFNVVEQNFKPLKCDRRPGIIESSVRDVKNREEVRDRTTVPIGPTNENKGMFDFLPAKNNCTKNDNVGQSKTSEDLWRKITSPEDLFFGTEFIACNLIQDLVLLKITSKIKAKATAKAKKLKRRLERRTLRMNKIVVEEEEPEQDNSKCSLKYVNEVKPKSFKPIVNKKMSNLDLLGELPFNIVDSIDGVETNSRAKVQERGPRVKSFTPYIFGSIRPLNAQRQTDAQTELQRFRCRLREQTDKLTESNPNARALREILKHKSAEYLNELKRKRNERLYMLEQLRKDNRLKLEAIMKERKEKLKKDASCNLYQITFPQYKDISEKLKQLKDQQNQIGFMIDSSASSDSDTDKMGSFTFGSMSRSENKISNEFMTALKVGKKVSHTFKEWSLKKAPTLTCLRNYCNSKVSQLSEKFSSQMLKDCEEEKINSLHREELETLKSRKEKHEQLKRFWRSKQQYLDKRIEICELLKEKLSGSQLINTDEQGENSQAVSQGVQILDSIINDVLKSVRISRSAECRQNYGTFDVNNDVGAYSRSMDVLECEPKPEYSENAIMNERLARPGSGNANSGALYDWLFEKRAMAIRKRDNMLWIRHTPANVQKREVSKHDPSRAYQERIFKKNN